MSEDLPRFSHSKLYKWNQCRFAYDLSYNKKWEPVRKPQPLVMGSVVHTLLEDYYEGVIKGVPDALIRHKNKVQELATSLDDMEEMQALSHAAKLVQKYITDFAVFEDHQYEVVSTEKHYEVELETPKGRPFLFELYFDLLLQDKANGRLWMVDHKTHKSNPWTPTQIMMDPQLPSYAMVMRELLDINIFGLMFNLLNTYDYKKPQEQPVDKFFRREKSYRTPEELNAILIEIGNAVDDVLDNQHNLRRSLQRDCDRCVFQEPCLMSMKGLDINLMLEDGFQQKKGRPGDIETNEPIRTL